ncbi:DUF1465 family protein [Sandarakinorhabdus sp. DWP1-3-1]|uniref:DUF1465 family protein n=1 Tax=Sandarakinorhabdus sp. DWP1-3-1 TaxID=2804627 RepID=UPI003CEB4804
MVEPRRQELERLYREAVTVADRARGWFDGPGARWRAGLSPDNQALVATESLAATSRLMASMSWLLDPSHAVEGAPLPPFSGDTGGTVPALFTGTPGEAIIIASRHIAARIAALSQESA